jgi:hypothetical protein
MSMSFSALHSGPLISILPSHPELRSSNANIATTKKDPERPHEDSQMGLRGGDRGGMCPGRFCFCVPCPLPCDFCII